MATSADLLAQMQGIGTELDPLAADYASAPQFFQRGLSEAFGENLPLLKEAAALEAGAYALPGQLMGQYAQDYGGMTTGPSAMDRLNSILGRIGGQFGMADVASGLARQRGLDIKDLASTLTQSYGLGIEALEDRYNRMTPLYQTQVGVEEAQRGREFQAGESAKTRAASQSSALQFQRLIDQYTQQLQEAQVPPGPYPSTYVGADAFAPSTPYPARVPEQTPSNDFMSSRLGQMLPGMTSRNQFLSGDYLSKFK